MAWICEAEGSREKVVLWDCALSRVLVMTRRLKAGDMEEPNSSALLHFHRKLAVQCPKVLLQLRYQAESIRRQSNHHQQPTMKPLNSRKACQLTIQIYTAPTATFPPSVAEASHHALFMNDVVCPETARLAAHVLTSVISLVPFKLQ